MKILLFHTYNQGYLSSFFHELSVKLIQEGHEVVSFSWKASVSEQIIEGVKVIVKRKEGYLINYRNVYNVIKKERPEVIVSNFSYVNPALLFGKIFKVKKNIVWFHSLNKQINSSATKIFIKRQFLKLTDAVIANSYLTKKELNKLYHVPEYKIQAIPFWTTISEQKKQPSSISFFKDENVINIGCPGRIAIDKNQKVILEALSTLKHTYNKFHLYFAGVGEGLSDLEKQVEILNLTNEVTFLKHLSANDMLHFYKSQDVVVLPSLHEAFGLVFIEAISLGTPVIVSSQFGALSFVNDNNKMFSKFVFNPNSEKDLQEKLKPFLEKKGLTKAFYKALYQDNFNKDLIFKKFLESIQIS
ncbi:glycosyltransferase family 4 protein [Oceanihabitans sp. 2_MG-2023]|uniref:glycosyltransferase family 4 protein n=1 Tax=Oceanihabitans sp. 2_MG-2023 TaxID=3062661 RepID=UPI0026E1F739|nr:glycosyltransferase family 4 protein [Oceanihabitans sp. 2_MG-2023]MDO6597697.1 glycosyltransferase family 4 protein [Oceanihabitans sp. 2_MG-2023]